MVELLRQVMRREALNIQQAEQAMELILAGQAEPEQIAALLVALQMKGETSDEIFGFVSCLKRHARLVEIPGGDQLLDLCGTGGDGAGTFNVSTTVAFVVAAAGQKVAKHGNRAVSSRSGSFDVLEQLGIPFASNAADVRRSVEEFNLAFLFAPDYHPVLKNLAELRRKLGTRTVFNLLGPLLNPAGVRRQLIGVYSPSLIERVAEALRATGAVSAMVVCGEDGLDEMTLTGVTHIARLQADKVVRSQARPEDCGLKSAPAASVQGGDARKNAQILLGILCGDTGPRRDLVLYNAAAALVVGDKAANLADGVARAREALDSGRALALLKRMQQKPKEGPGT